MLNDRMRLDEWYWNYEFRFDLRDAEGWQQREILRRFKAAKLDPVGFTKRHVLIVEDVLGRTAYARQSPYCHHSIRDRTPYLGVGG